MRLVAIPWLIRAVTGVQARWQGCAPSGVQRIYFANHASNLDFLMIWALLPAQYRLTTRPVAAHDYWTSNRFRNFLAQHVFNAVLIERKKVSKSNNPLEAMQTALDAGHSLIIFPEGSRKREEDVDLMPFKSGLYHLMQKNPLVELVPVYLHNMNRILPAGEFLFVPLLCSAAFGTPLEQKLNQGKQEFLQRAEQALRETEKL
jgi:1-acyl-sn-glycerol-3-phosphate acyltransferase